MFEVEIRDDLEPEKPPIRVAGRIEKTSCGWQFIFDKPITVQSNHVVTVRGAFVL